MTFIPMAHGVLREAHDDRPHKEFKLKRDMTNDEIREALGVGAHSARLLVSENAFYTEVDGPTPEGCQFFGWRTGPDTFNVVATESHAWLVAKAEAIVATAESSSRLRERLRLPTGPFMLLLTVWDDIRTGLAT